MGIGAPAAAPDWSKTWTESVTVPARPQTYPTARFDRDVPEMLRSP
jgi:hypothetical protein